MAGKTTKGIKAPATNEGAVGAQGIVPPGKQGPEADFNDTIARNRGLKLLDLTAVSHPPTGFRPTDPVERMRRIRWLSSELRSEAIDALREGGKRDLQAELGRFAPDPQRALVLADRVGHSGEMVARAEALLAYAKEVDQIGMSDALVFLETEQKQYLNAVEYDAGLAAHYRALVKLFEMRSGAIAEGIARAKTGEAAAPAAGGVADPGRGRPSRRAGSVGSKGRAPGDRNPLQKPRATAPISVAPASAAHRR